MADTPKPDWEAFGRCVMERWLEGDAEVDLFDVQMWAEKHAIITKVPGGFDPDNHIDINGCAEPGDDWFQIAT